MTDDLKLCEPDRCALFLDVDGTLIDIEDHPGDVVADPALLELLERIAARLDGALALVSGRTLQEIDRIFSPRRFAAAGGHGAELRLPDGTRADPESVELPAAVLNDFRRFAGCHDGLLLEEKPAGLSLHYRRAPELETEARRFAESALQSLGSDFRLIDGKMVLELTPAGNGKDNAIRLFLERRPYRGRTPVFVGDDVTDEDGFRYVNDRGGLSVRAGEAEDSAARYAMTGVREVRRWLRQQFSIDADNT
ncbi:MAG: trehalose-phosphatase [Woeseiaceae bacterium]|nr:trehalose-phosphatase [Woeseiaceae bacterium]